MPLDCDLAAVVYDPPAPGLPHMAVLFDSDGEVIAVRPVGSIGAGEEALVSLVSEFTTSSARPLSASSGWSTNDSPRAERALFCRVVHSAATL